MTVIGDYRSGAGCGCCRLRPTARGALLVSSAVGTRLGRAWLCCVVLFALGSLLLALFSSAFGKLNDWQSVVDCQLLSVPTTMKGRNNEATKEEGLRVVRCWFYQRNEAANVRTITMRQSLTILALGGPVRFVPISTRLGCCTGGCAAWSGLAACLCAVYHQLRMAKPLSRWFEVCLSKPLASCQRKEIPPLSHG